MSAARYWDGFVRTAVSHRFVAAPGQNQTVRVELLSCGHEQSFSGNFCRSSIAARICRQCEDANIRVPLEVGTAHGASVPRPSGAATGGERDTGGVR